MVYANVIISFLLGAFFVVATFFYIFSNSQNPTFFLRGWFRKSTLQSLEEEDQFYNNDNNNNGQRGQNGGYNGNDLYDGDNGRGHNAKQNTNHSNNNPARTNKSKRKGRVVRKEEEEEEEDEFVPPLAK
eukprot:TRINITY_DN9332_c0_g1_i2.p2 TRINITY_DN9332_c0_g1~~TRINITY_DN9332_c0_g1_i2.p2  ORF type:complete len:129 (-),score=13.76 TRINITY_DN9332_c0_g1_i2:116-502(-)